MRFIGLVVFVMLACLACGGDGASSDPDPTSAPATGNAVASTPANAAPSPTAPAAPLVIGPNDRLRIPKIGVDAPLSLSALSANGSLGNPVDANTPVVYDLSNARSLPTPVPYEAGGTPQRGLLAIYGYLSRQEQPRAVFFDLPTLTAGDVIEVTWQGQTYQYTVVSRCFHRPFAAGEDAASVYRATQAPTLLLHTHVGRWPSADPGRQFTYGMVFIRAEQRPGSLPAACAADETADVPMGFGGDQFGR